MNTLFTFILGMLSGWLLEWLIDYFFGRRPSREGNMASTRASTRGSTQDPRLDIREALPAALPEADDLKIIKGIGKVIERKLNEAGIFTFEQLGKLSAEDLRGILGKTIQRLADEDSLIRQARELARGKQAGGRRTI